MAFSGHLTSAGATLLLTVASGCRAFHLPVNTDSQLPADTATPSSSTTGATGPQVCWQASGTPDTLLEDQTGELTAAMNAALQVSVCGIAEVERVRGTLDRGSLSITHAEPTVSVETEDTALRQRLEDSWTPTASRAQLLLEAHPSIPGAVRYAVGQLDALDTSLAIGPRDGLNETGLVQDAEGFPVLAPFAVDAVITLSRLSPDDPAVVTDAVMDTNTAVLELSDISETARSGPR